ncbi:MAG: hypothetical protein HY537_12915 [Deltaproteobacteria bacterium]|nr:hypothetical protein [Deltaproteobacteria bacterium]
MLAFLVHFYYAAEVYTVLLLWLVTPLGFYLCYRFFQSHYQMFSPPLAIAVAGTGNPVTPVDQAAAGSNSESVDGQHKTEKPEKQPQEENEGAADASN